MWKFRYRYYLQNMIAVIPKEVLPSETRVAATPATVKELAKFGISINIEKDAGMRSHISNDDFENAGAKIIDNSLDLYKKADIVLKELFILSFRLLSS